MQAAGDVKSAQVIRYPDGRSKGWGLVEFNDPSGAVVVRKASVLDAALSQPKNRRRGHPHAFRLDLEHPDTEGVKKYICAAATAQLCQAWRDALESHAAGGGGTVAGAAAAEA